MISNVPRAPFVARDWKSFPKNTLLGFVSIEVPSGVIFKEVSLHEKNGSRWINLPSRAWSKPDGTTGYQPLIDFRDSRARTRFQDEALLAINKLLAEQGDSL